MLEERELFSVTTLRWLYNDEQQRAVRYVPFNVQAFVNVGLQAAGATKCTSLEKLQDGALNRVFLLTFDNDVELIAKIPYPCAGPRHFCTASEVATLDFLRTELGFPVPHVRAWSSRAEQTAVGAEFIMYEKIPGIQLRCLDDASVPLPDDPHYQVLAPIQRMESRLSKSFFSQIGSIYYKEDVPEALRARSLYSSTVQSSTNSERFRIGPTVNREFWRAGRAHLDIDRGPWPDVRSWLLALAACARASADVHPDTAFREEYYRLISDYEKLVPYLAPRRVPFILWHPDFHARNIIVTAEKPHQLSGIIDWQSAVVAPDYMQLCIPPAYTSEDHPLVQWSDEDGPTLSPEVSALSDDQKRLAHLAYRQAERRMLHELLMRQRDPALAEQLHGNPDVDVKRLASSPAVAITRGNAEGLGFVGRSLLDCRLLWAHVVGVDSSGQPRVPFPIQFSEADEARIEAEWSTLLHEESICDELFERLGIEPGSEGAVRADEYEKAKQAAEEAMQAALDAAPTQEERERVAEAWPLQDGKLSLNAESCY
ncbi:hypothetical protein OH77DRAFT_1482176 [Trametes cingulata]|nr:hypothetical protein OH77DRAFT_1482176 [Trametes cingulata]